MPAHKQEQDLANALASTIDDNKLSRINKLRQVFKLVFEQKVAATGFLANTAHTVSHRTYESGNERSGYFENTDIILNNNPNAVFIAYYAKDPLILLILRHANNFQTALHEKGKFEKIKLTKRRHARCLPNREYLEHSPTLKTPYEFITKDTTLRDALTQPLPTKETILADIDTLAKDEAARIDNEQFAKQAAILLKKPPGSHGYSRSSTRC